GGSYVSLFTNPREPAHDAAVRAVAVGRDKQVSVACPLTRKWARTLDAEFKSGACHAGLYETSIMMAAAPEMVDDAVRGVLPAVPISLSQQLAAGVTTFAEMGMELAYAGDPAAATVEEGERMIQRLAERGGGGGRRTVV